MSPDFASDIGWVGSDILSGQYEDAVYDTAAMLIPIVPGGTGNAVKSKVKPILKKAKSKIDDVFRWFKVRGILREASNPARFLRTYNRGANPNAGKTVLGSLNDVDSYISKNPNANYLRVDENVWNVLDDSGDAAWNINRQFLDDAIERGDDIVFATSKSKARLDSYFKRELDYLVERGYTLLEDRAVKTIT